MQPLPPSSYSVYDAYEFAKSHGAPFVQLRSGKIVRLADWPTFRDASHVPLHVVPGSFNPLHKGHMAIFLTLPLYELSDYGDRSMFRNVPGDPRSGMGMRAFELSISTVDKEPMSAEELEELAKRPEAVALLLSGLAAVHANAEMFGGLMSDSFKSKWKHLDRRGKALCKIILGG